MSEEITLWGDLLPEPALSSSAQGQEKTLDEGKITDVITGDKDVKDTPKEQVRQFIAEALNVQYNIAYEDMKADFPVMLDDGDRKRRKLIDIAIFHHEQPHELKNLARAVFCYPEPQVGRNTVRLRDPKEATQDLHDLISVMREFESCQYGLWTNGLECRQLANFGV